MVDRRQTPIFDLTGRRALVTGAQNGIGRAIATGLAGQGATVAFHDRIESEELSGLAAAAGGGARAFAADLRDARAVRDLARQVEAAFGGVDILVLCASIEVREPWHAVSDEAFTAQVAINLDATRLLLGALVPGMAKRNWGRVLAIGSVQEVKEHPQMLIYAALKTAQTSMMRNLARQLGREGITFNTLAPGAIETGRNAHVLADEAYRRAVVERIPMGAIGTPEDCVGAAIFLCSEAARYVTGTHLLVDGGMHL